MQFHGNNSVTDKLEREGHQRLFAAPRFTYTTAFVAQAKLCHFPYAIHTLAVQGRAAQYRFANFTSQIYGKCEQLLRDTIRCHLGDELGSEYHLTPLLSQWWQHSIMAQINRTVMQAHFLSPELQHQPPAAHLQRRVAQIFLPNSGLEDPFVLIDRRLERFLGDNARHSVSPRRTLATLSLAKHPFLTATVVKTWINGWCTSKRYQLAVKPCMFGCGHELGDSLEHYRCCPIVWSFYRQHAPYIYHDHHHHPDHYDDTSTTLFLALHAPPDIHHTTTAATLLHAVFTTYETLRTQQRHTGADDHTDKTALLNTKLHFTLTKYPRLHDNLTNWTPDPHNPHRQTTHRP